MRPERCYALDMEKAGSPPHRLPLVMDGQRVGRSGNGCLELNRNVADPEPVP